MKGSIAVIREPTGHEAITLWSKKGEAIPVLWLGWMPKSKAEAMTIGGWGKMPAVAVTNDSSPMGGWRDVLPHQFVLCYRVPSPQSTTGWGAYAVTDNMGWPIVMTPPYTVIP